MQGSPNQLATYIVLENRRYRLIEPLPSLGGGDFVLCSDENGAHFVCPEELWRQQAPQPARLPASAPQTPPRKRLACSCPCPCSAGGKMSMSNATAA